ncbi:MAG: hypothetical protein IKH57_22925 [Clostridia bacterium]|jgi:hypothetical protein|nr:hypothetical protein [Clostridia bacterium]
MIIRNAKERRPGTMGFAEAMLIAYNTKNKYRLPMTKLYGNNNDEEMGEDDRSENENTEE